jgi:hypothetical protein
VHIHQSLVHVLDNKYHTIWSDTHNTTTVLFTLPTLVHIASTNTRVYSFSHRNIRLASHSLAGQEDERLHDTSGAPISPTYPEDYFGRPWRVPYLSQRHAFGLTAERRSLIQGSQCRLRTDFDPGPTQTVNTSSPFQGREAAQALEPSGLPARLSIVNASRIVIRIQYVLCIHP